MIQKLELTEHLCITDLFIQDSLQQAAKELFKKFEVKH